MTRTKGIVYIAVGKEHLELAIKSAQSVLKLNPTVNIKILADAPSSDLVIDISYLVIFRSGWKKDVLVAFLKTQLNIYSPFDMTLYLDNDIRCVGDISDIWQYCGDWLAVSPAFNSIRPTDRSTDAEIIKTKECLDIVGNYMQYNTGVFLFKKLAHTNELFNQWRQQWGEFRNHENMAFTRLTTYGIPVAYLPHKFNDFYPHRTGSSVLIHYISWYKKYLE
jgi:hypothetical protein